MADETIRTKATDKAPTAALAAGILLVVRRLAKLPLKVAIALIGTNYTTKPSEATALSMIDREMPTNLL